MLTAVSTELWIAFVAASAVMLAIPGPTILTVIAYAMSYGRKVTLPLVCAVALGDATALAVSLVGLGALLATSAYWFAVIKWIGGLYLIYLGIRLLTSGVNLESESGSGKPSSLHKLFANTYIVTALNPKGIVFFMAFLPQFVDHSRPLNPQLWLLAVTFVLLAIIGATLYASFAGAAHSLMHSPAYRRTFNVTGGSLLVGAGIWALLARRPA
jgi:threonine/homoserine/homoserine lactone efflux protein